MVLEVMEVREEASWPWRLTPRHQLTDLCLIQSHCLPPLTQIGQSLPNLTPCLWIRFLLSAFLCYHVKSDETTLLFQIRNCQQICIWNLIQFEQWYIRVGIMVILHAWAAKKMLASVCSRWPPLTLSSALLSSSDGSGSPSTTSPPGQWPPITQILGWPGFWIWSCME